MDLLNRREPGAKAITGPLAVRCFGVMVGYNGSMTFASGLAWTVGREEVESSAKSLEAFSLQCVK